MQISNSQLYAHTAGLQKLFSYSHKKYMDVSRLPALSKQIFKSIPLRTRIQDYVLDRYTDLANYISSGLLSLRVFDAYILGEYIKTGKFPAPASYKTFLLFSKNSKFYSIDEFIKQVDDLCIESRTNNTAIAKFTKTNKSLVKLRKNQTNLLYDMLKAGQINIITYSYVMLVKDVKLNFDKMNIDVFRVNKIAEYFGKFDLSKLLHSKQ